MLATLGRVRVSVKLPRKMLPRDFCREWFNASEEDEHAWGYRTKCIELLAEVVGLQKSAIERWGAGPDFSNMPTQYQQTLGYAMTIKRIVEATNRDSSDLMKAVLSQLNPPREDE